MKAHLLITGTANLASVEAAVRRAGWQPVRTDEAAHVRDTERLVVPGVGTLAAAMDTLETAGVLDALRSRLEARAPTLCVCLGMQLLFEGSDESAGARGLGVVPGRAVGFDASAGVRVPQLGWNWVEPEGDWSSPGYAYFANSYCIRDVPPGWRAAYAVHDGRFAAALTQGGVLGCQFHPELSGPWGQALVEGWLAKGAAC